MGKSIEFGEGPRGLKKPMKGAEVQEGCGHDHECKES